MDKDTLDIWEEGDSLLTEMDVSPDFSSEVSPEVSSDSSNFEEKGLSGNISDVNLLEILQFFSITNKTKLLEVYFNGKTGRLYIENGQIIHAVSKNSTGEEVAYECLSCDNGSFKELEWSPPEKRSIEAATLHILLEAVRLKDEGVKTSKSSPDQKTEAAIGNTAYAREKNLLAEIGGVPGIHGAIIMNKNESDSNMPIVGTTGKGEKSLPALTQTISALAGQVGSSTQFESLQYITIQSREGPHLFLISFKNVFLSVLVNKSASFPTVRANLEPIIERYEK